MPEPSDFEFEMVIKKRKRHKSAGTDHIPVELIKSGGRIFRSEIHNLINSIRNKEELPEEWKKSIIVPSFRKGDKRDCSNHRHVTMSTTYKISPTSCCQD